MATLEAGTTERRPDQAGVHLILQVGDTEGALEQKQETGTKRYSR